MNPAFLILVYDSYLSLSHFPNSLFLPSVLYLCGQQLCGCVMLQTRGSAMPSNTFTDLARKQAGKGYLCKWLSYMRNYTKLLQRCTTYYLNHLHTSAWTQYCLPYVENSGGWGYRGALWGFGDQENRCIFTPNKRIKVEETNCFPESLTALCSTFSGLSFT